MGMTNAKGSETNDYVLDEPEDVSQEPVKPTSAGNQEKKVRGRPITKENAKEFQLSAARAKRQRKIARARMLDALCNDLDLGAELVKAVKAGDESRVRLIEKAVQIVGLHHDQSCEAAAQRFEIKSQNENKQSGTLEVLVKGLAETGN